MGGGNCLYIICIGDYKVESLNMQEALKSAVENGYGYVEVIRGNQITSEEYLTCGYTSGDYYTIFATDGTAHASYYPDGFVENEGLDISKVDIKDGKIVVSKQTLLR